MVYDSLPQGVDELAIGKLEWSCEIQQAISDYVLYDGGAWLELEIDCRGKLRKISKD